MESTEDIVAFIEGMHACTVCCTLLTMHVAAESINNPTSSVGQSTESIATQPSMVMVHYHQHMLH